MKNKIYKFLKDYCIDQINDLYIHETQELLDENDDYTEEEFDKLNYEALERLKEQLRKLKWEDK